MADIHPYEGVNSVDFAQIAKDFDFRSAHPGVVDSPDQFVQDYVEEMRNAPDRLETGIGYSVAHFADGSIICDPAMLLGPGDIYWINKILDESLCAEEGAIILPPDLYAIGECYDDYGKVYLMANLEKKGRRTTAGCSSGARRMTPWELATTPTRRSSPPTASASISPA